MRDGPEMQRKAFKNCFYTLRIEGDMLTNLGKMIPSEVSLKNTRDQECDYLLQTDLGAVMEEIDTDKSGGIDFEEFLDFMTTERGSRKASSDASEYSDIFDFMDVDKNGLISAEDLKKVQILVFFVILIFIFAFCQITEKLGQKLSSLQIDEMIEDATEGDGTISKEQFLRMMIPQSQLC